MYTLERDEELTNVWFVLDPEGVVIFRHVGDMDTLDALLSHLNR